jgi:hypothetical protein
MEYDRFKSSQQRPLGSGAFFDYASAVTRLHAQNLEALRARMGLKKPRSLPQNEPGAEQRWDGEGGNSQTRIARRAERYERERT